jgi:hypothetical protein
MSNHSQLRDKGNQVRSNDVRLLGDDILRLVAFVLTGNASTPLEPALDKYSKKTTTRGFRHPQLGALLAPIDSVAKFEKDPQGYGLAQPWARIR